MKADTYELRAILAQERRFVVPTFQRDYEWTKDGQWELLFDDLESVADNLAQKRQEFAAAGKPIAKADRSVAPHFLGAIVLDQLSTSAGSLEARSVIDGQQRLTTVQLMIRAVLDVLLASGSARASQLRRMIQNPEDVTPNVDDRHKLWPRRRDREVWRIAMADSIPSSSEDHGYIKARRYFRERTEKYVSGEASSNKTEVLVDALVGLFKLVAIDLEDNDDAQVIFEVLNGRQTPLSATDLVKNLLFLRAELDSEDDLEKLYDAHWRMLDDPWWRREVGRGHAARERRDVLLSTWLTTQAGTEVNVGHLYGEVRRFLDAGDHKTTDILPTLSAAAAAFRKVSEPTGEVPAVIREAYGRFDRLAVTTALPLLVWLRTLPEAVLSPSEHARAVVAIDSWVIRRMLVGANTRGYGKRFVDVLKQAQAAAKSGHPVGAAVEQELLAGGGTLTWITDQQLEEAFLNRPLYGVFAQERLRLLLGALDAQMHRNNPKGEHPTFDYDKLQIEHVLPQAWRTHWAVNAADASERELLERQRDAVVDRIGNLTLVTSALNPAMSNGAWDVKRAALQQHANLRLNTLLAQSAAWDENAVAQRARELCKVALQVWPRPADASSPVVSV